MASGNWVTNALYLLVWTIITPIVYAIGFILNIFTLWDVTTDLMLQLEESFELPEMSKIYLKDMPVGA